MKLTKRELFMLIILFIIALVFIEYRFLVAPAIDRYDDLMIQDESVQAQIDQINLELAIAENQKGQIEDNFSKIEIVSDLFPSYLSNDSLILFSHNMMMDNELNTSDYSISPIRAVSIQPQTVTIQELMYEIKETARTYRVNILGIDEEVEPIDSNDDDSIITIDQVEEFILSVNAIAAYDDMMQLILDIESLNKNILVINIVMNPVNENMLNVNFDLAYYGIEKLNPEKLKDEYNTWPRESFTGHIEDPFLYPVSDIIENDINEIETEDDEIENDDLEDDTTETN